MSTLEHVEHGFGPVWDQNSRVLILGSMPSLKSRDAGFYFMNPRNRFWPVLAGLFHQRLGASIGERTAFLLDHHIALWDVIESCDIRGSQDSTIVNAVPNNLAPLLKAAPITTVCVSGNKAAQLYHKLIEPELQAAGLSPTVLCLPSTSPANAAMSLETLIRAYRPILGCLQAGPEDGHREQGAHDSDSD